ncbi:MAG: hydroxymethylbilane synthase [Pseudomonadota bacterium]
MTKALRIATRQSKLALWQAEFVAAELRRVHPDVEVELVKITTKGDRWLQAPLSEIGGKGLFVKELEVAMLEGRADLAVHSAKDLPAQVPEGFCLPVFAYRTDVRDVLIVRAPVVEVGDIDATLAPLNQGAVVGSSSLRRQAQLAALRPDLQMRPIRGNVDTRLQKLANGEFDAIVLAAAGLARLKIEPPHAYPLPVTLCLPAPGQAALAIETPDDDAAVRWVSPLNDDPLSACVAAERGVSRALGADCSLPIAAQAGWETGHLCLEALVATADGRRLLKAQARAASVAEVVDEVVSDLYSQGAREVLRDAGQAGPTA